MCLCLLPTHFVPVRRQLGGCGGVVWWLGGLVAVARRCAGAVHATACVTQRDSCPPQSGGQAFCVYCERPVERCLLDSGCGESAAVIPRAVAFFDNDDSWLTSPPSVYVCEEKPALQFGAGIVYRPSEKKRADLHSSP